MFISVFVKYPNQEGRNQFEDIDKMIALKENVQEYIALPNIKVRSNVHEGVKQYSCDRCEKTFGTGKSLKRHISIIHLGERKFPCLECGKAFGRSSHLNKHVLFVHKGLKSTHEDTNTNTKLLDIVH